jgi:endonuclease/exonuclease/phosphatase family metal-dependent hydrolase
MFSILTYNTHLFDGIGGPFSSALPLFEEQRRVRSLIDYLNSPGQTADLVGLTEVWSTKNKEAVMKGVRGRYPHAFFEDSSSFSIGDGLLLLSKNPLAEREFHQFSDRAGDDNFSQKGILSARLSVNGSTIRVFLTHTQAAEGSSDKVARAGNLAQIRNLIGRKKRSSREVVVVLGDLNVVAENRNGSPTREYATVLEPLMSSVGLADGFRQVFPNGTIWPGFTFDGPKNGLVGEFAPEERNVRQRLDYVFSSAATMKIMVQKPNYFSVEKNRAMSLSDHFGLLSQIDPTRILSVRSSNSNYRIVIKTVNDGFFGDAGTDSNIFLTMWGETGFATDEIRLNSLLSGNIFERGDTDTFNIMKGGLGSIKQIKLRSEGNDDWEPKSVTISNPNGSTSKFVYGNVEINKSSPNKDTVRKAS